METRRVDVAVIGAGTAGLNARREVEREGGRALLIEHGPYGTTCARVGCMPSKLLIAAAETAHAVAGAHRFGVQPGGPLRIDGPAVLERVRRERDRFAGFAVRDTEAIPEEHRLRGHARFAGPTTLVIDVRVRVEARAVVVATGSRPHVPAPFAGLGDRAITSDDVFELSDLPESLAVIGAGVVALELGQAMGRLGVRVAFFNRSERVGPLTDPELRRIARRDLSAELDLRLRVDVRAAREEPDGIRLYWTAPDGTAHDERFAAVLVAAGRRPNVEGLDLEAAGVALDARGAPRIDPATTQCGNTPVFCAGDINDHRPVLHEAADEGRIAGSNAMRFPDVARHERRTRLAIAFCDPQMALAGTPHAELRPGGHAIGTVSFEDQGRARVILRNRGLVRVYADVISCRLVGAELFGPEVEHMAHLLSWAIQQGMTVQDALSMPFYHPVLEEGLRTALRDLAGNLRILDGCRPEDQAVAPGT